MTSSRYTATIRPTTNGHIVTTIDRIGTNHAVTEIPTEFGDALYEHMSNLFNAGIARYGTVERFTAALEAFNQAAA